MISSWMLFFLFEPSRKISQRRKPFLHSIAYYLIISNRLLGNNRCKHMEMQFNYSSEMELMKSLWIERLILVQLVVLLLFHLSLFERSFIEKMLRSKGILLSQNRAEHKCMSQSISQQTHCLWNCLLFIQQNENAQFLFRIKIWH